MKKSELRKLIKEELGSIFNPDRSLPAPIDTGDDLDIGHEDDEPNSLRKDLYRIKKYAGELCEIMEQFDNIEIEVDFPHWFQTKITKAKDLLITTKHYLDGEMKINPDQLFENKSNEEELADYLYTEYIEDAPYGIPSATKIAYEYMMDTDAKINPYYIIKIIKDYKGIELPRK
jgi:hypothetical protein